MDDYGVDVGVAGVVASAPAEPHSLDGFVVGAGPMATLGGWTTVGTARVGVVGRYRYTTYGILAPRVSRPGGSTHPRIHELDTMASVELLSNGSGPQLGIGWSWNWAGNELSRSPTDTYSGYNGPLLSAGYVVSLSQHHGLGLTVGVSCTYLLSFETALMHASVGVRKSWGP